MASKVCPVENCDTTIMEGEFFCRAHWKKLPGELQDRIWNGLRQNQPSMFNLALRDAKAHLGAPL